MNHTIHGSQIHYVHRTKHDKEEMKMATASK